MENIETYEYGISTHVGTTKDVNEDRSFIRIGATSGSNELLMAVVADGMGGLDDAAQASEIAVESIKAWWDQRCHIILQYNSPLPLFIQELRQCFFAINEQLIGIRQKNGKRMGTTLSLLFIYQEHFFIHHVGDSRIYRKFNLMTNDHSWVNEQIKFGLLSKEEARLHPRRNVLTQCLGGEEGLKVDFKQGTCINEELFLICSDGFYSLFSDTEIKQMITQLLGEGFSLQEVTEELVRLSLQNQAKDNISILMIAKKGQGNRWKHWIQDFYKVIKMREK
jgi:serine/threonine protein phosphatase PrpC